MSIAEWRSTYRTENQEKLSPPQVVIYAGGSPKRKAIITQIFSDVSVVTLPGGEELDTAEVNQIADGKINHVFNTLPQDINSIGQNLVIIAADTRTRTLQSNHSDAILVSQGKPASIEVVQKSFQLMNQAVNRYNLYPIYFVDAATGYLHFLTKSKKSKTKTTTIGLCREYVTRLATENGFDMYLKAFEAFYQSNPYENSGFEPMSINDLSAGFSLPVLYQMGAVDHINGVGKFDSDFPMTFKSAMYNVAVGVHPEILSNFSSNPQKIIDDWTWLNQVTEYCLQRRS